MKHEVAEDQVSAIESDRLFTEKDVRLLVPLISNRAIG